MEWWVWVVMGLFLLVVEMVTPGGLFAIFFGVGALLIAPVALLGAPAPLQWILYTVVSLVMLATLRGYLSRRLAARGATPVENLLGEQATLIEDLPAGGQARAELRGTQWTARSASGEALAKGQRCRVERIDGLTLLLRAE